MTVKATNCLSHEMSRRRNVQRRSAGNVRPRCVRLPSLRMKSTMIPTRVMLLTLKRLLDTWHQDIIVVINFLSIISATKLSLLFCDIDMYTISLVSDYRATWKQSLQEAILVKRDAGEHPKTSESRNERILSIVANYDNRETLSYLRVIAYNFQFYEE